MQRIRVKVRKKGQITLPQQLRNRWGLDEGSEIVIAAEDNQAIIRPIRRTKVRDAAGALGQADSDEIEFAIIDPELIFQHYSKRYGK
ncbi:MAG: AbrB/MazE/SpoVT family DNA-binding domain-containing protein [Thaumarchaeota archaeon]|nr:AbrB/MazE/SpoVT family DNA-binding domain-containing protein [Nitrososphaerota archaeon]